MNRHINWAKRQNLPGTRKGVLINLADHANAKDLAWPKIQTISSETGFCRDTVIDSLADLEKRGYIEDTRQHKGKTNRVPIYRLLVADMPAAIQLETGNSWKKSTIKQSEISEEIVGKSRLVTVRKDLPFDEAKHPENENPNPQGSLNVESSDTPKGVSVTPSADVRQRANVMIWRSHYSEEELHAHTANVASWRHFYSRGEMEVIGAYHRICVPYGWRPINQDSPELHKVLSIYLSPGSEATDWETMFRDAVNEREEGDPVYNRERGNKLIRILYQNISPVT
jgi:hypothetical protein